MKSIGSIFDYIDKNHNIKHVKIILWTIFATCLLTTIVGMATLPSHEEYCKTAVNNITCKGE